MLCCAVGPCAVGLQGTHSHPAPPPHGASAAALHASSLPLCHTPSLLASPRAGDIYVTATPGGCWAGNATHKQRRLTSTWRAITRPCCPCRPQAAPARRLLQRGGGAKGRALSIQACFAHSSTIGPDVAWRVAARTQLHLERQRALAVAVGVCPIGVQAEGRSSWGVPQSGVPQQQLQAPAGVQAEAGSTPGAAAAPDAAAAPTLRSAGKHSSGAYA